MEREANIFHDNRTSTVSDSGILLSTKLSHRPPDPLYTAFTNNPTAGKDVNRNLYVQ